MPCPLAAPTRRAAKGEAAAEGDKKPTEGDDSQGFRDAECSASGCQGAPGEVKCDTLFGTRDNSENSSQLSSLPSQIRMGLFPWVMKEVWWVGAGGGWRLEGQERRRG